ncbi:MAG: 4-(cytidine 5'-diphospho)-2-C-methyl-D-erythritol kinase [Elusimicrobia bacterium]|nr:4-(cytidine 5'-diphospho)-2-C-methyl-D-erythritol kinase [Elusimicrobiota bacterium]
MKLKAPAKINLFLDILNKRKDGYHNLKTVFQRVSLFDDISIKETESGIKVSCDDPGIPTGKENIAYKAAVLVKKYSRIKKGVLIRIKKGIPVGAGLGGGSSDAAEVLKGLNRLWNLKLSKKNLIKIAKKIGADVPFFASGLKKCMAMGIGDILTPLSAGKKEWYVIVKPSFNISTKFVYSRLNLFKRKGLTPKNPRGIYTGLTKQRQYSNIDKYYNRLEDVVIPLYPEIEKIKEKLVSYGAEFSLMSGSGSCVFGFVKDNKIGNKIKNSLKKDGYSVWLVHTV